MKNITPSHTRLNNDDLLPENEYLPDNWFDEALHSTMPLPLKIGSEGFNSQQDYVIKNILPADTLTCIYGASGSYKSFLAVSFACHVATGLPWAGHRVRQNSVLYIAAEGSTGVARRIRAWELYYQSGQYIPNLYRIDLPVYPADTRYQQAIAVQLQQIEKQTSMPVKLIILDTLARCFGGADENTAQDMGAFIQGCDAIRQISQATILIVHHSGKDKDKGARGSSAFKAALDAEYHIQRDEESDTALMMRCTKMKDAQEPPSSIYTLQQVTLFQDEDNEEIISLVLLDQPENISPTHRCQLRQVNGHSSANHQQVLQAILTCTKQQAFCSRKVLLEQLKQNCTITDPARKLTQWLSTLAENGLIDWDRQSDKIRPVKKKR